MNEDRNAKAFKKIVEKFNSYINLIEIKDEYSDFMISCWEKDHNFNEELSKKKYYFNLFKEYVKYSLPKSNKEMSYKDLNYDVIWKRFDEFIE